MNSKTLHKLTAGLAIAVVFSSCVKDENSPGYEYMPDMYRSPAIETYVDYGEVRTWQYDTSLTNRQSALLPPMGTIAFSENAEDVQFNLPYKRLPSNAMIASHSLASLEYNDGDYEASVADVNPLPLTQCNVEKGKELYNRFCTHCHGEKGAGDGKVSMNENINPPATAFKRADGQMFYSITYGKGVMGAHASQLNQKERWQVINYIKSMDEANVVIAQSCDEEAKSSSSIMEAEPVDLSTSLSSLESGASLVLDNLVFATGSSNLDMAKSQSSLDDILTFLKGSNKSLEFDGHTDNTGNEEANKALSLARANAVKSYLVGHGISASRIETQGFGSSQPKVSNDTEEGRAQNRRTEVKIK